MENAWVGYLGYEMLHATEMLPKESQSYITLADLWFTRFGFIACFDHMEKTVTCLREPHIAKPAWPESAFEPVAPSVAIASLTSPISRDAYLTAVKNTKEAIMNGDFYQANITRKFTGEFREKPNPFALFCALAKASPGAYSAYIQMPDAAILSSSPERFLTIDAQGAMESRPIKGTAPRHSDPAIDASSRAKLEASEKDRAENLMIVDLMRNDFSRSATFNSVKVERLFEISSYATLHHMASTITATKRAELSTLDAVKYCFPPGSMTGAPKIHAMKWCAEHEAIRRGVYSGALGWFGGDGSCDLSVVIRTLILQGNRFEFQVGGGIVADSDPVAEWQETITKARGIMAALGLDAKILEEI